MPKRSAKLSIRRSTVEDFFRPGHVDPLIAKEGGVLRRAGHTEASVDLARMAGLDPAGVLCEILDEDGDRADRDGLFKLAERFHLPIITIEDLIRHRRRSEQLVHRLTEANLPTQWGEFRTARPHGRARSSGRAVRNSQ